MRRTDWDAPVSRGAGVPPAPFRTGKTLGATAGQSNSVAVLPGRVAGRLPMGDGKRKAGSRHGSGHRNEQCRIWRQT